MLNMLDKALFCSAGLFLKYNQIWFILGTNNCNPFHLLKNPLVEDFRQSDQV